MCKNCNKGSCNGHCRQSSCGSMQDESKSSAYFLHKLEEMLEDNFMALHEEIEELEDKIERLEKLIERRT